MYNGFINSKDDRCISVYRRGSAPIIVALGGVQNSSYAYLPISIVVHWTEDSDVCESIANGLYTFLNGINGVVIGTHRIISFSLLDPAPLDLGRDSRNIVEASIRLNIIYER